MAYNCNLRKQKKVTVSIRTTIAHNGTSRGTQLNFEDPVLMGNVKRSSIDKPTPELATLKVLAEFYKGILGLENGIDEHFKNHLTVLDKTHKVFLNPTSVKQILLSDKNDPLPLTEPVGVNLQDFKTEILKLQTNAKNLQNEEQACALKMILNALENLNLLSIEQIADIYYVFGKDIMVDDKQMKEILISMTNNGFFVPDDAADYMQKFKEFPEKTINWKTVTKVIVPEIIIGADGEMCTKRNVDESQNKLLPEIVHIYIDPKTNAITIIDKK
ncbi:hypothetical protein T02_7111 [Trichinella nativa]|uniref:Uncharacterized protein n=2 Tax=Trichinella TaxID=6333 RepID=A0A0V1KN66_9BILA|nr:hypothetical protein T02_13979 [Trichinella nativa]KRZ48341.1 hypothetical protein T02_7111 [Trichinella nativa]